MIFKNRMVEALSHVEVFEGLTQDDLKMISKHCKKIGFEERDTLVEMGLRPSAFYILLSGQLRVFLPKEIKGKKERRVSEINLNILNKGDCFGEYSLIERMPASASVAGVEPGEVIKITDNGFDRIMADDRVAKTVYYNLLHVLIKRLRKKEQELDMVLVIRLKILKQTGEKHAQPPKYPSKAGRYVPHIYALSPFSLGGFDLSGAMGIRGFCRGNHQDRSFGRAQDTQYMAGNRYLVQ